MKTLIVAINSKYIHSALAPWYLKAACADFVITNLVNASEFTVNVSEYTINDLHDSVLKGIYEQRPDVVAFCCYIWNIEFVIKIASNLKKINPGLKLIFGGPEVSYDSKAFMTAVPYADFVLKGEGEDSFPALLKHLYYSKNSLDEKINSNETNEIDVTNESSITFDTNESSITIDTIESSITIDTDESSITIDTNKSCDTNPAPKLNKIPGLVYKNNQEIIENPIFSILNDLSTVKSPYTDEMLKATQDKIIYFESSRGCPFSCSYCLSSTFHGVRYFPIERVKSELKLLILYGTRQIKFVDRTFNANINRAKEIIRYIAEECKNIQEPPNFHFEIAADLFDEELIAIIEELPKGLVQLEIGIQTINTDTLLAIHRKTDIKKVFENVKSLRHNNNLHLHLDLIAGLPFEDFESFKNSFNMVYSLKPHQLQLGFLKLLKGSKIRRDADIQGNIHKYSYKHYAPYEIFSNKYINFDEILVLKKVEDLVDKYYNSLRFIKSLEYIISFFKTPFLFYQQFADFASVKGYFDRPVPMRDLYKILLNYVKYTLMEQGLILSEDDLKYKEYFLFKEYLKYDFLNTDSSANLPIELSSDANKESDDSKASDNSRTKSASVAISLNVGTEQKTGNGSLKEWGFEFLKNEGNIQKYLPKYIGQSSKQIYKKVYFEKFEFDVTMPFKLNEQVTLKDTIIIFDYSTRDKITNSFLNFRVG